MNVDLPVVRPVCNARSPELGSLAVLVASQVDLKLLAARMQLPDSRPLYMSRLFYNARDKECPVLAGPLMGAPYAAMIVEILRAWGVNQLLFFGWCGSIDSRLRIGDIMIPTSALVDEGTSLHYRQDRNGVVYPDQSLCNALKADLSRNHMAFKTGRVWTTDGIFRETPEKIAAYQGKGAQVVEMELSALLSVAAFHGLAAAGVLAVSDELFTMTWKPGFKNDVFTTSRRRIIERLSAAFQPSQRQTGQA